MLDQTFYCIYCISLNDLLKNVCFLNYFDLFFSLVCVYCVRTLLWRKKETGFAYSRCPWTHVTSFFHYLLYFFRQIQIFFINAINHKGFT